MTNTHAAHFARGDYVDYGIVHDFDGATRLTCALLLRADTSWTPIRHVVWMDTPGSGSSGPFGIITSASGGRLHLTAWVNGGANYYDADIAVPSTSEWIFVVFSYDNGAGTWYADGAPLVTVNDVLGPAALDVAASALRVGDSFFSQAFSLDVVAFWTGYAASAATVAAWWTGAAVVHPYESVGGVPAPTRELNFDASLATAPAGWVGAARNDTLPPPTITYSSPGPTTDAGAPALVISPDGLPDGAIGAVYNQALAASNVGSGPYAWSLSAGALPPGLALDPATGAISGTPTTAGAYAFTVQVARTGAANGTQAYAITIAAAGLVVSPSAIAAGRVGTPLVTAFAAVGGGSGATAWTITGGALPPGLALDGASGVLSGTPTIAGSYNFLVRASRDSGNYVGSTDIALTIGPSLTVLPPSLPDGALGVAYAELLTATGGGGEWPYAWSIVNGALPPGLELGASVVAQAHIAGVPTVPGAYTFTVAVAIAHNNGYGERTYTIVIPGGEPVEDIPQPPGRGFNGAGSAWVTASGTASRRDRVATVAREGVGVYFVTMRPGSGRSPAEFSAAIGVLSASPRLVSVRAEDGGWRVRTFDATGAAADANFSLRLARL